VSNTQVIFFEKANREIDERKQHHRALDHLPDRLVGMISRLLFKKRLQREKCRMCDGRGERSWGWSLAIMVLPEPCRTCLETGYVYVPRG
jgi:hypothetical protein